MEPRELLSEIRQAQGDAAAALTLLMSAGAEASSGVGNVTSQSPTDQYGADTEGTVAVPNFLPLLATWNRRSSLRGGEFGH